MNELSTHVLDTSRGCPAKGLLVRLEFQDSTSWRIISNFVTDENGRVSNLIPDGFHFSPGIYRLTFVTEAYFQSWKVRGFYPYIEVVFEKMKDDHRHFHIPLLLSPFGYSTYRGC